MLNMEIHTRSGMTLSLHGISAEVPAVAPMDTHEFKTTLYPLTCDICASEWVTVVGSNGSGKSTFARILAGLTEPSQGSLTRRVPHPTSREMTLPIQLVMQNPDAQIIGETVWEDVCFALENIAMPKDQIKVRAEEALHLVGLWEEKWQRTSSLSGGQKQLLCIASSLAVHPSCLIFDEATSMLDKHNRFHILQTVKRIQQEQRFTVIWITQWMDELPYGSRVMAFSEGHVAYDGEVSPFFYEGHCSNLGFAPPFAVQVAIHLKERELGFQSRPLTPQDILKGLQI